jgi:hypothetical protein
MPESVIRDELRSFATELRRLAYTMPAGHEDRLIALSDRMVHRAGQFRRASDTA